MEKEKKMTNLQGSWVAMPTPFTEDDKIDFQGFETLINRQIQRQSDHRFTGSSKKHWKSQMLEQLQMIHGLQVHFIGFSKSDSRIRSAANDSFGSTPSRIRNRTVKSA